MDLNGGEHSGVVLLVEIHQQRLLGSIGSPNQMNILDGRSVALFVFNRGVAGDVVKTVGKVSI